MVVKSDSVSSLNAEEVVSAAMERAAARRSKFAGITTPPHGALKRKDVPRKPRDELASVDSGKASTAPSEKDISEKCTPDPKHIRKAEDSTSAGDTSSAMSISSASLGAELPSPRDLFPQQDSQGEDLHRGFSAATTIPATEEELHSAGVSLTAGLPTVPPLPARGEALTCTPQMQEMLVQLAQNPVLQANPGCLGEFVKALLSNQAANSLSSQEEKPPARPSHPEEQSVSVVDARKQFWSKYAVKRKHDTLTREETLEYSAEAMLREPTSHTATVPDTQPEPASPANATVAASVNPVLGSVGPPQVSAATAGQPEASAATAGQPESKPSAATVGPPQVSAATVGQPDASAAAGQPEPIPESKPSAATVGPPQVSAATVGHAGQPELIPESKPSAATAGPTVGQPEAAIAGQPDSKPSAATVGQPQESKPGAATVGHPQDSRPSATQESKPSATAIVGQPQESKPSAATVGQPQESKPSAASVGQPQQSVPSVGQPNAATAGQPQKMPEANASQASSPVHANVAASLARLTTVDLEQGMRPPPDQKQSATVLVNLAGHMQPVSVPLSTQQAAAAGLAVQQQRVPDPEPKEPKPTQPKPDPSEANDAATKALYMRFHRSVRSKTCPPEIVQRHQEIVAMGKNGGKKERAQLFEEFLQCGENWASSEFVVAARSEQKEIKRGKYRLLSKEDLLEKYYHNTTLVDDLIRKKEEMNMYQQNPDFEAQRLFWCWDSTSEISDSINSRSMEVQKSGGIGNKDAASIMTSPDLMATSAPSTLTTMRGLEAPNSSNPQGNRPEPKPKPKPKPVDVGDKIPKQKTPEQEAKAAMTQASTLILECKSWEAKLDAAGTPQSLKEAAVKDLKVHIAQLEQARGKLEAAVATGQQSDELRMETSSLASYIGAYKAAAKSVKRMCSQPKPKGKAAAVPAPAS